MRSVGETEKNKSEKWIGFDCVTFHSLRAVRFFIRFSLFHCSKRRLSIAKQKRKNRTSRTIRAEYYREFDPLENSNRKKKLSFLKKERNVHKFELRFIAADKFYHRYISVWRDKEQHWSDKIFPRKIFDGYKKVSKTYVSTSLVMETRIINVNNHNVTVVLYHVLYSSLTYSYL